VAEIKIGNQTWARKFLGAERSLRGTFFARKFLGGKKFELAQELAFLELGRFLLKVQGWRRLRGAKKSAKVFRLYHFTK